MLLLVHVPPKLDYPLFKRALKRSLEWHADPEELKRLLKSVGFDVEHESFQYEHKIPKDVYFNMVRNRYMSLLSSFAESEIEEGIAEMTETYSSYSVLKFTDHFDYLAARKPSALR